MQPFLHKNEGSVSRGGLHADAVHKGLHQGKAHARPLLIRLGGIKAVSYTHLTLPTTSRV